MMDFIPLEPLAQPNASFQYVQEKARVLMTGIYYFEIVIFHVLCAREVLIVRQLRLFNFLLSIPCGCFPQTSLDQQRTDSMS